MGRRAFAPTSRSSVFTPPESCQPATGVDSSAYFRSAPSPAIRPGTGSAANSREKHSLMRLLLLLLSFLIFGCYRSDGNGTDGSVEVI
jgi:hypothetical protein